MEATVTQTLSEWREGSFIELGFSLINARLLAQVKEVSVLTKDGEIKRYESPLHHSRVEKLLSLGATHQQIMDIYI